MAPAISNTRLLLVFTNTISASGGRALLQARGLWLEQPISNIHQTPRAYNLLGRAQPVIPPVIPPNLYNVNEHISLGSPGKLIMGGRLPGPPIIR